MGHQGSGHDPATDTPFMGRWRALGVAVRAGGDDELPEGVDAVVVSTATPADHPAVAAARAAGAPVLHRSAALGAICAERLTLAVAGTPGKTTTSAMLATILEGSGRAPGWVVGESGSAWSRERGGQCG